MVPSATAAAASGPKVGELSALSGGGGVAFRVHGHPSASSSPAVARRLSQNYGMADGIWWEMKPATILISTLILYWLRHVKHKTYNEGAPFI